jgi:hypothetical protein
MPVVYDLKNDMRNKDGLEVGKMRAATSVVLNLLKRTDHSDRKIAFLAMFH